MNKNQIHGHYFNKYQYKFLSAFVSLCVFLTSGFYIMWSYEFMWKQKKTQKANVIKKFNVVPALGVSQQNYTALVFVQDGTLLVL